MIVTALLGLAIIVPVADAGAVIKGSYIVTLKPDTKDADVQSHLTWVKDVHKRSLAKRDGSSKGTKGVEKVYDSKSGFKGYAGTFDADTIKKIKKNPNVRITPYVLVPYRFNNMTRSKSSRKTVFGKSATSGKAQSPNLIKEPKTRESFLRREPR